MDNISYLNQISASAQPKKSDSLFGDKKLHIFFISAAAIFIACILFAIINSIVNRETDYLPRLNLRAQNLSSVIKTYNPHVKSSSLRAAGASLSSIIDNITTALPAYIDTEKELPESITSEESDILSGITTSLAEAKINGLLDRAYARELSYGVSLLISLETEALNHAKNDSAKTFLSSSMDSLNNILPAFSNFSETSK
ncbi:hypothetical protein IJF86_03315 [Candidatus Saccharibacteria bacterium]|nr:hypothetical protein [Candidatus Saccharibacteria bacterium]